MATTLHKERHEHRGLPIVVARVGWEQPIRYGQQSWPCGYVGVQEGHPWFGRAYQDAVDPPPALLARQDEMLLDDVGAIGALCADRQSIALLVRAWQGLTFSGKLSVDYDPEQAHWWFGFDCNHHGDAEFPKDEAFVLDYCRKLADDLLLAAASEEG